MPGPTPPHHALNITAQRKSDTGAISKCRSGQREISSAAQKESTAIAYPQIIRFA
jgi:hypothetical protein